MKKLTVLATLFVSTPLIAQIDPHAPDQVQPRQDKEVWTELQGNVQVEGDHQVVPVKELAKIRRIRIEAKQGSPFVTQVMIKFQDGRKELWGVGKKLSGAGDGFDIEISRKDEPVESVIIFADPNQPGSYSVMTQT